MAAFSLSDNLLNISESHRVAAYATSCDPIRLAEKLADEKLIRLKARYAHEHRTANRHLRFASSPNRLYFYPSGKGISAVVVPPCEYQ
jgi:hypothetical protein